MGKLPFPYKCPQNFSAIRDKLSKMFDNFELKDFTIYSYPCIKNTFLLLCYISIFVWECLFGVVVSVLDCNIVFQMHYYFHFQTNTLGKGINLLIPLSAMV